MFSARAIDRHAPIPLYAEQRYFMMALAIAAGIHLAVLLLWMILPRSYVLEVPVRTLNIKLGEQKAVAALDRALDEQKANNADTVEKALNRFFDKQEPAKPASKPAEPMKKAKAEKVVAKPVPKPKPAPAKPAAKEVKKTGAPTQTVRDTAFNYQPIAKDVTRDLNEQLPKGGSPQGNSEVTQAQLLQRYEQLLSLWVEKFKIYPPQAQENKIEGTPIVYIKIDRRGNVRHLALYQSSGNTLLDRAALEMIRRADPVPPVPDNYLAGSLLEFKIPIIFKLPPSEP